MAGAELMKRHHCRHRHLESRLSDRKRPQRSGMQQGVVLLVLATCMGCALLAAGFCGAPVTIALGTNLHEDVTAPQVKRRFLAKFDSARAHQATRRTDRKDLLAHPLSGLGTHGRKGGKEKPTAAQRAAIAARMKALRAKILGDFASNTRFGKRVDCSYPYPAASCKEHAVKPGSVNAHAMPMAFGKS